MPPDTGAYARPEVPEINWKEIELPDYGDKLLPVYAVAGDDSKFLGVSDSELAPEDLEHFTFAIDQIIFLEGSIQVIVRTT